MKTTTNVREATAVPEATVVRQATAEERLRVNELTRPIRVLIVDDHTILRQGLRRLLESQDDIEVVGEARDGREAVEAAKEKRPHIVLMDLWMPQVNGLDATRRLLRAVPDTKVIVLSMYLDGESVHQSLEAGVSGYLMKDASASDLLDAIREVASGKTSFAPQIPAATIERYRVEREEAGRKSAELTRREREVLKLLAEGHTVREVAEMLRLSQKTVDTHKTNLMKKLGIHNRVALVKYAIHKKIIQI